MRPFPDGRNQSNKKVRGKEGQAKRLLSVV